MKLLGKARLALAVLTAAGLTASVQAAPNLNVPNPVVTGAYNYAYTVTPSADTSTLTFSFTDTNVTFVSATTPLTSAFSSTAGNFLIYTLTPNTVLKGGSSETVTFSSPDPENGFVNVTSNGAAGAASMNNVEGPGPVPEASTTVSLGLLLMLGIGGVVLSARKNKAQAAV